MKYQIHYANGTSEQVESEETREQLLSRAQPILDVTELEKPDARQEQATIQVNGGGGEQPAASQAEGDSAAGGEGVHVENKKRKTTSKKG